MTETTSIKGLPNSEYHFSEKYRDYLSSSQIKAYLSSPKAARLAMLHPAEESTPAMEFGSLYHSAMQFLASCKDMDADEAADLWRKGLAVFTPPENPKTGQPYGTATKAYAEAHTQFLAENEGKTVADAESAAKVREMVAALTDEGTSTGRMVRQLLQWGEAETSHFCEYNGAKYKWRPDLETRRKIIDWKTVSATELREDTVNRIIDTYGYAISAAFYQFFTHERTGQWKDFYWVFQSKEPPYDAVVVSAENWAYALDGGTVAMGYGAQLFDKLRQQHEHCTLSDEWLGAEVFAEPQGRGERRIMRPVPPVYTQYRDINFYNK